MIPQNHIFIKFRISNIYMENTSKYDVSFFKRNNPILKNINDQKKLFQSGRNYLKVEFKWHLHFFLLKFHILQMVFL